VQNQLQLAADLRPAVYTQTDLPGGSTRRGQRMFRLECTTAIYTCSRGIYCMELIWFPVYSQMRYPLFNGVYRSSIQKAGIGTRGTGTCVTGTVARVPVPRVPIPAFCILLIGEGIEAAQ